MRASKFSRILAAGLSVLLCLNAIPLYAAASAGSTAEPAAVSASAAADADAGSEMTASVPETGSADEETPATSVPAESTAASEVPASSVPESEQTDGETPEVSIPAEDTAGSEAAGSSVPAEADSTDADASAQASAPLAAPRSASTIYVGADGNDETNDGSEQAPYASLAKAVAQAQDGATIYLTSDLTVTEMARLVDKKITINGNGHTVTRGDGFAAAADNARSWYQPAMIEVTTPGSLGASLTLVNIVLDDAGKTEGTVFAQQPTSGSTDNLVYVQDGIVSAYGTDAATASIVLGEGAVLRNFGGMSAVRVTGGAVLTMQAGSCIEDTTVTSRQKGAAGSNGPAGAVWVQGTTDVTMASGAVIRNVVGRAFYVDGGGASIGGEITGMQASSNMWQGVTGIAVHARGGANVTLTASARIHDCQITGNNQSSMLAAYGSDLEMQAGARLEAVTGSMAVYMDDLGNDYAHAATINGTIANVENNPVMRSWYGHIIIGPTGVVQNCTASAGLTDGQVLYTNNGSRYTIQGQLLNNKGTVLYLANQSGSRPEATMEAGAVISGTTGAGLLGSGVAVRVNNGSLFTMNGGTISGNGTGVEVSGKTNFKGVTFVMNGGSITENRTGLSYTVAGESQVALNGGTISGNGTQYQIRATGGSAQDGWENLRLNAGVLQDNLSVSLSFGTLTFDQDYPALWLGTGSADAKTKIQDLVVQGDGQEDWTVKGSALWFKTETSDTLHFTMNRPATVDKGASLYAAYIPVNADGTPADDAQLTLLPLGARDALDVTLTGLTPGQSYALSLVMTGEYFIVVDPVDITIYMGGADGSHGVVDGNNQLVGSKSLPDPGFVFTLPKGLTNIENVVFREVNGTKTWKAVPYTAPDGDSAGIYKLVPADGQDPLRVQFTDPDTGNIVVSDEFVVGKSVNKSFDMTIYKGSVGQVEAFIPGDPSEQTYGILVDTGTLTVRGTTNQVQYADMPEAGSDTAAPEAGKASVSAPDDAVFTVNDTDVQAPRDGIALLFDGIINTTATESDRLQLLEDRADTELGEAETGMIRHYAMQYLDLVDRDNGNSWIKSSEPVTVYWPYPEGTGKDTDFALLHFDGLDRDMASGTISNAIEDCTVSEMTILEKTDTHIVFETTDFSPFALSWDTPNQPPVISASDRVITVGDAFNPMQGVTASDPEDGVLTDRIQIKSNNVEPNRVGVYQVTFQVTDNNYATTEKTITVTVTARPASGGTETTPSTPAPVGSTPATGDTAQPLFWLAAALAAAACILILRLRRQQNR